MTEKKPRNVKAPEVEPRATGDAAAAAGMTLVSGGALANTLEDIENQTRDFIATYATRTGKLIDIYVQSTAPAHKVDRIWIKKT